VNCRQCGAPIDLVHTACPYCGAAPNYAKIPASVCEIKIGQHIRGVHYRVTEAQREQIVEWFTRELLPCLLVKP
jgi:predicted amidophosphoribosyltransferase